VRILASTGDGAAAKAYKRARIDAELALGEAIARLAPTHPVLRKMLDSYREAVGDPDKEFFHLYEIWDALKSRFDPKEKKPYKAETVLGLEKGTGGRFESLTNDRRLLQSRHRGQHLGELRSATPEELRKAREIALGLIQAYVQWADEKADREDA
jgi:hypothetical protein